MRALIMGLIVCYGAFAFGETVTGVILGERDIALKAKSQGEIRTIDRKEGDVIEVGDIIATINDDQEIIEFELARTEFDSAKRDFNSTKRLAKFVSKEEILLKKDVFLRKKSNMEIKQLNLDNTRIVSPIKGIVAKSYFKLGETVAAGDTVVDVVNMENLVMNIYVPIQDLTYFLAKRENLEFRTLQDSAKTYGAKVGFVSPVVDSASGTVKIKLKFPNQKNPQGEMMIRPGTMAFVDYSLALSPTRLPAGSKSPQVDQ